VQQTLRRPIPRPATSSLLVASAAVMLAGCASADDFLANVAVPALPTTSSTTTHQGPAAMDLGTDGGAPSNLVVTAHQRDYLNTLDATGVHPASDLLALSIGSYICQAQAAGQSDQAVRDFVLPLVREDRKHAAAAQVDAATDEYIRVATDRLC
jgi:Protein of unknown function (DUF732)